MGGALAEAIAEAGHTLSGGADQGDDVGALAASSDALIDFSAPVALQANLDAARAAGIPILIGTTGLEDAHFAAIEAASQAIPVLQTGNTSLGDIGFATLRGGSVAGDHSVILAGEQERITLSHSAENRMIFARGAVRGATWLIGKGAGRYAMNDVLGL